MVKQIADKPSERSDSKFRGVRKRKWGKWVSEVRLPNSRERIWLGSYDSAVKAARAFDAALFCLRGRSGNFNFPDNPPDIFGGRSMSPAQIQAAAARFANSEHSSGRSDKPMTRELAEESPSHSLSEATVVPVESSSPSLSEVTVQTDSEMTLNESIPDLFKTVGSGNYANEYGIFAGFDDLTSEFYIPEMPSVSYEEENMEGLIIDDSFLWNF